MQIAEIWQDKKCWGDGENDLQASKSLLQPKFDFFFILYKLKAGMN